MYAIVALVIILTSFILSQAKPQKDTEENQTNTSSFKISGLDQAPTYTSIAFSEDTKVNTEEDTVIKTVGISLFEFLQQKSDEKLFVFNNTPKEKVDVTHSLKEYGNKAGAIIQEYTDETLDEVSIFEDFINKNLKYLI